jgi:hypothetical protein
VIHSEPAVVLPLPRQVTPLRNEVLSSFLGRLADYNGLRKHHIVGVLNGSPLGLTQTVAQLTGRPEQVLLAALPELRSGELTPHRPSGFDAARLACCRCALRRTGRQMVLVWSNTENIACFRHRRWLGLGEQIDLGDFPHVFRANRRHHELLHRYQAPAVRTAFDDAAGIIGGWIYRGTLPDMTILEELVIGRHSAISRLQTAQMLALRYPATVRLTALLADPTWTELATSGHSGWDQALDRVANLFDGHRPTNTSDPLVRWKNTRAQQHPDRGAFDQTRQPNWATTNLPAQFSCCNAGQHPPLQQLN